MKSETTPQCSLYNWTTFPQRLPGLLISCTCTRTGSILLSSMCITTTPRKPKTRCYAYHRCATDRFVLISWMAMIVKFFNERSAASWLVYNLSAADTVLFYFQWWSRILFIRLSHWRCSQSVITFISSRVSLFETYRRALKTAKLI